MKKTFLSETPCEMRHEALFSEDSSHKAVSKKKGFLHGFMVKVLVTSAKRSDSWPQKAICCPRLDDGLTPSVSAA
jgi:hypothetical protein